MAGNICEIKLLTIILVVTFLFIARGQETPFDEPPHPRLLDELNSSSYESLIHHGDVNLAYGR